MAKPLRTLQKSRLYANQGAFLQIEATPTPVNGQIGYVPCRKFLLGNLLAAKWNCYHFVTK
jgi:hypothetical protein